VLEQDIHSISIYSQVTAWLDRNRNEPTISSSASSGSTLNLPEGHESGPPEFLKKLGSNSKLIFSQKNIKKKRNTI